MATTAKLLTEDEIIGLIARLKCSRKNLVSGDDIARFETGKTTYAGSDSLIENVHYKEAWLTPADIAYKLFARNWSDFLCKGIKPTQALLNLNLKRASARSGFISPFLRELDKLMVEHQITLIGGDTARSPKNVFTLTFLGSSGKFIPRQGAGIRPGDVVVQLGKVGGSDLARKLMARKKPVTPSLRRLFTRPQIFKSLPQQKYLKAALDQSDSVAKTLRILAQKNGAILSIAIDQIAVAHQDIRRPTDILAAAEDLAVFAIAGKNSTAFRVIGHVESIRGKRPGVVYRHRCQPFALTADGGKTVSPRTHDSTKLITSAFEHFKNS